jgi:hypothetical protein
MQLNNCGLMGAKFLTAGLRVKDGLLCLQAAREAQGKADWVKGVQMEKGANWTG